MISLMGLNKKAQKMLDNTLGFMRRLKAKERTRVKIDDTLKALREQKKLAQLTGEVFEKTEKYK